MKSFLLSFVVSAVVFFGINIVFNNEQEYKNYTVIVAQGDTLWDIAAHYSGNKEDIREVVYRISQENNLKTKYVYPGQKLTVPVSIEVHEKMILASK